LIASQSASAQGVAPDASILSVQITTSRDRLVAAQVTRGLAQALERGCQVISCSFTLSSLSDQRSEISALVRQAHLRGIPVVGAQGNDPGQAAPFPEAIQHAIAVSAHDVDDEPMPVNHNRWTDIFSLGDEVDVVNGSGLTRTWTGNTSGATALVAGCIALALAAVDPSRRVRVGMAMDGLLKVSARRFGTSSSDTPLLQLDALRLVESAIAL
jgi:hypothetical protein